MRAKDKFKAGHPYEPLDKFSIFDSVYYRNYGNDEMKLLCEYYGQEKLDSSKKKHESLVDYESCVDEWKIAPKKSFKTIVKLKIWMVSFTKRVC